MGRSIEVLLERSLGISLSSLKVGHAHSRSALVDFPIMRLADRAGFLLLCSFTSDGRATSRFILHFLNYTFKVVYLAFKVADTLLVLLILFVCFAKLVDRRCYQLNLFARTVPRLSAVADGYC